MNEFLLKLLDLFKWLFRALGVDYEQLRAIVKVKLAMDNRRNVSAYKRRTYRRKENEDPDNTFIWTLFFYALFGGFVALAMFGISSLIISMIMFFSYIMVMISMTMITDFSAILLDTSDNTIILPRPVDSRTLFVSRITHILLYLGQLTAGLSILPCVAIWIKYDFNFLLFFMLAIVLAVVMAIFITNAFYLLILQFSNEERLKSVINYFQIIMAIVIMAGYQILPRIFNRFELDEQVYEIHWWSYLTPPIWMAGALEALHYKIFDADHLILMTCAVTVPLIGFYLVNQYLTPIFTRKLGVMGSSTEPQKKSQTAKTSLARKISGFVSSGSERAAFELIYNVLGRDRKIKLKIYPAFGYIIVAGLVFILNSNKDISSTLSNLPSTQFHLMLIYIAFMAVQVAFYEIPYSDDFKANWIYFSAPLEKPGNILSGTLKAIFVKLFIPIYVLISVFVIWVWGLEALDDIVFGLFNNFLMLLIIAMINKRYLPLSMEGTARNQSGAFIRGITMLILVGGLGFGHYLLSRFPIFLIGTIPIQLIAIFLLLREYKNTSWNEITL